MMCWIWDQGLGGGLNDMNAAIAEARPVRGEPGLESTHSKSSHIHHINGDYVTRNKQ
jgi:hypothetical protein